jgi:SulP family sulfate permease
LGIIEILGGLYFGAVSHVEEFILDYNRKHPYQRFLIIRMHNVNHCDFSGIHMLESVVHTFRERGGDVFMVRVNPRVRQLMESTGFDTYFGEDHFVAEDEIIRKMFYHVLDPAICIYECPVRVFKECQNLPKRTEYFAVPGKAISIDNNIPTVASPQLWEQLHEENKERPLPFIVDVREPREYRQGHIIEAHSLPLSKLLKGEADLPTDRSLILVCRTGRRSRRAAQALHDMGRDDLQILDGGMRDWQASGLIEAIGPLESQTTID